MNKLYDQLLHHVRNDADLSLASKYNLQHAVSYVYIFNKQKIKILLPVECDLPGCDTVHTVHKP
jgi:hypothetical protein